MIIFDDVLKKLADHGWTTYRLVHERVMGNSTIARLRTGGPISTATVDTLCRLCECQPGDLMRYEPDKKED